MSDQTLKLAALAVAGYLVWKNWATIKGWVGL